MIEAYGWKLKGNNHKQGVYTREVSGHGLFHRRTSDAVSMGKVFSCLIAVTLLEGCCWWAKRDCFPPCPPTLVAKVEKTCKLPPPLTLPAVERAEKNCPQDHVCFDISNAARLIKRQELMKDWIVEARARCGEKTVDPEIDLK